MSAGLGTTSVDPGVSRGREPPATGRATPLLAVTVADAALLPAGLPGTAGLLSALRARGSWPVPVAWGAADRWADLDDRVSHDLAVAVDDAAGPDGAVSLLGIGEAGVVALCFAALFPERVSALALVGTPVDFAGSPDDALPMLAIPPARDGVERLLAAGELLSGRLLGPRFRHDLPASGLARVATDGLRPAPALARPLARDWFVRLHRDNALLAGTLAIGRERVDLSRVRAPVLAVLPADPDDPLGPASRALAHAVGSEDYDERALLGPPGARLGGGALQGRIAAEVGAWFALRVRPVPGLAADR